MSRPIRIEHKHGWYHVINRGKNHHDIYRDDEDCQIFYDLMKQACERYQVKVASFCLMTNHYHLLVYTPLGNLSQYMRQLNGCYVQKYNKRHGIDGPLYKGRYKSFVVERESYLLKVARYIHHNPLRAGLSRRLWEYPWSSHRLFLRPKFKEPWFAKDEILAPLGKSYEFAMENFLDFMRQGVDGDTEKFYSPLFKKQVIGTREYSDKVKSEWIRSNKPHLQELPQHRQFKNEMLTLKILKTVADEFMIDADEVITRKRGASNLPRKYALCLVRDLCHLSLKQIASVFEMKSYKSVGILHKRYLENFLARDNHRERYHQLKRECIKI